MRKSVCHHAHAQTKRPKPLKFGTEIIERVFEKNSKWFFFFFSSIDLDFQNYLKKYFLGFQYKPLIFSRFLNSCMVCEVYSSFSTQILKKNFEKTLKRLFSKIVLDYVQGHIKIQNICQGYKSRKNLLVQLPKILDMFQQ